MSLRRNAYDLLDIPVIMIQQPMEGRQLIVQYRAFFIYFDPITNNWEHRGGGWVSLFQSIDEPKRCRVIMSDDEEGTEGVLCNFDLHPGFHVDPFLNQKVLTWRCVDYSGGPQDGRFETFCCEFLSTEACDDFKNKLIQYAEDPTGGGSQEEANAEDHNSEVPDCHGCCGCDPSLLGDQPELSYAEEEESAE